MKGTAVKIDQDTHGKVQIYIDIQNSKDILPYVFRDKVDKEFKEIRGLLKENLRNREKYCKADVSKKAKDMFEMRFTRDGRNDRIYCKEFRVKNKRQIVMIELYEGKKTQNISKKYKSRIETMGGYYYEL